MILDFFKKYMKRQKFIDYKKEYLKQKKRADNLSSEMRNYYHYVHKQISELNGIISDMKVRLEHYEGKR